MDPNPDRVEAERLLGIAEKLLNSSDLVGSRDFAVLAQETDPLIDGSDQIIAVTDVLLASDKRINNHHDWYSILQIERRSDDPDLIRKQYRKLALLLHPDKNKFPSADHAFKLVADAWAILSDPSKKTLYDNELTLFSKVDLAAPNSSSAKLPVRRNQPWTSDRNQSATGPGPGNARASNGNNHKAEDSRPACFWTACPYCYTLFEYPRVYEGCCLRCQKCQRAFHAAVVPSLPPQLPGQEAYYCCWGFFPVGYVSGNSDGKAEEAGGFPNWMPPVFPNGNHPSPVVTPSAVPPVSASAGGNAKKRGRSKKY